MPTVPAAPQIISILGCGWLGLPLLRELAAAGYQVRGSSRNPETLAKIEAAGGAAYFIDLPDTIPAAFLEGVQTLIITLPPRGRTLGEKALSQYLENLNVLGGWLSDRTQHVIFCSSTGVYGGATGVIDENGPLDPDTASARAVAAAEQFISKQAARYNIIRLAGLVGPGRHPGRFYGGRGRRIPQADAPVNLVYLNDVIAAIRIMLRQEDSGVYNVCSAAHPAKGTYYTAASHALGLAVAGTVPGGENGKRINSSKLRSLGWQPGWDDLALNHLQE